MTGYNYSEFVAGGRNFDRVDGADVGDKAPDFLLETTDGETKALLDFSGEFLVLEMGSITCPLFQSQRGIMETLNRQNGVSTAVLYVREAHPGAVVPGHKSFEDKIACATRLRVEDG
ncbi:MULTISPECIES: deiodinase-like protein [Roseobacteraceae]|uniref:Iodothyronine deiodinase n=1 Tax=Pseudosulfitobacter pseudonitzschiae TaxID=1402135 RepID=A0A221JX46_9RHOB|nr:MULTISPECIES: deiodinase-like protein [Roseobacteraceae]ASM71315.1 iodothyronine deiodinase [Pseudosulfitobacter pseudonitzschiae]